MTHKHTNIFRSFILFVYSGYDPFVGELSSLSFARARSISLSARMSRAFIACARRLLCPPYAAHVLVRMCDNIDGMVSTQSFSTCTCSPSCPHVAILHLTASPIGPHRINLCLSVYPLFSRPRVISGRDMCMPQEEVVIPADRAVSLAPWCDRSGQAQVSHGGSSRVLPRVIPACLAASAQRALESPQIPS